jgi:hypothetical protein
MEGFEGLCEGGFELLVEGVLAVEGEFEVGVLAEW